MVTVHPEALRLNNNYNNNSTYFVWAEKQIIIENKPRSLYIMFHLQAGTLVS